MSRIKFQQEILKRKEQGETETKEERKVRLARLRQKRYRENNREKVNERMRNYRKKVKEEKENDKSKL